MTSGEAQLVAVMRQACADKANILHPEAACKWQDRLSSDYDAGYDDGARAQARHAASAIIGIPLAIERGSNAAGDGYSWATSYSAGSDAMIYRRFKGSLPLHAVAFAIDPPPRIVAFCEEHGCDVALYDELRGVVRRPRLGKDEAP